MKGLTIKYPVDRGINGYFEATYSTFDTELSRLRCLMNTWEGERFMQPDYGININKYLFDNYNDNLDTLISNEIINKLDYWLPNLSVDSLNLDVSEIDNNKIAVTIKVSLKSDTSQFAVLTFSV